MPAPAATLSRSFPASSGRSLRVFPSGLLAVSSRLFLGNVFASLLTMSSRSLCSGVLTGLLARFLSTTLAGLLDCCSALLSSALACLFYCLGSCGLLQRSSGAVLLGAHSALSVSVFTAASLREPLARDLLRTTYSISSKSTFCDAVAVVWILIARMVAVSARVVAVYRSVLGAFHARLKNNIPVPVFDGYDFVFTPRTLGHVMDCSNSAGLDSFIKYADFF
jgi:hypothetical protein